MELISLKTFKAIVDEGGIKGASQKLNTVQSNISARIQRLEQTLDVSLFALKGRKLELTSNGKILYQYANQMIQLESQARHALNLNKGHYELTIGTPETFAAVHLPAVLKKLRKKYPCIQPRIHTATSGELINALKNNLVDCAFGGIHPNHPDMQLIPVVSERMVRVTPSDQNYEPVLFVRGEGCGYRRAALIWQQEMGYDHEERMIMSSVDGVLGCIAAGLGYTIIGRNMVENSRYEDSLTIEEIEGSQQILEISLIFMKNTPLEEGIRTLASLFHEDRHQGQT